jgi:hypothetical protein
MSWPSVHLGGIGVLGQLKYCSCFFPSSQWLQSTQVFRYDGAIIAIFVGKNSHFAVDPSLRLFQKTDFKWNITIFEPIS